MYTPEQLRDPDYFRNPDNMREFIYACLDNVRDLSKMGKRQLLERILRSQERMELLMSQSLDDLRGALDGLDSQMESLKTRLAQEAAELRAALANQEDSAAIEAAAARIEATAQLVSGLAVPSAVVDPDDEATAGPLPEAETPATGTPATETPATETPATEVPATPENPVDTGVAPEVTPEPPAESPVNQSY